MISRSPKRKVNMEKGGWWIEETRKDERKTSANLSTLGKWVQETRKEEKQDEAKHRHICLPGREEVKKCLGLFVNPPTTYI